MTTDLLVLALCWTYTGDFYLSKVLLEIEKVQNISHGMNDSINA